MAIPSLRFFPPTLLACLLSAAGLAGCRFLSSPQAADAYPMVERSVSVGGQERSYLLYIPEGVRDVSAAPVVLVFHGGLGKPENMPTRTGFNTLADKEGFIVAYPRGTSRSEVLEFDTWNAGLCCGYAQKSGADDVGFVRALLDDLASVAPVDSRRIFATGLSNGAILSYRLACEMADRIAAIGPVSGTQNIAECTPSQPVSVIHFHGTADPMVPYNGGFGSGISGVAFTSVWDTADFWIRADGCPTAAEHEESAALIRDSYSPCADGTAVELYTIIGGGHSWPDGRWAAAIADESSPAVAASAVMWDFFKAHPKPETRP